MRQSPQGLRIPFECRRLQDLPGIEVHVGDSPSVLLFNDLTID